MCLFWCTIRAPGALLLRRQTCLQLGHVQLVVCPNALTLCSFSGVCVPGALLLWGQVCLQRGQVQSVVCLELYTPSLGDTCDSIMSTVARPPLSPAAFFALNPGLLCPNLIPSSEDPMSAVLYGQQVLLARPLPPLCVTGTLLYPVQ